MSKGGERNTKYGRALLARKYNEQIGIKTYSATFDGFSGETTGALVDVSTIWADYMPANDETKRDYGIDYNVDVAIFRVRSSALPTPTKDVYIDFRGKLYSIRSIKYIRSERREIEITAVEYAG